jgi:hypothetical protein
MSECSDGPAELVGREYAAGIGRMKKGVAGRSPTSDDKKDMWDDGGDS